MSDVVYDPYSAEVRNDPHPFYKRLRDEDPIHFVEKYGVWVIARFQDVWDVSNDTEHLTNARGTAPAQLMTKDQPVIPTISTTDPPEHTSLRSTIRRCFLPRNVRALEVHARELCASMAREALERGTLDAVREFGSRLSVTIACRALGLPVEDGPYLTGLVQGFFEHDPDTGGMSEAGLAHLGELNDYCVGRVRERRGALRGVDDPLEALATFEHEGRRYTDDEAGSHLGMLVIGGSETFPKLLASSLVRLAEHPHFRAELREHPDRIPDAFDEALRFDMPTQFLGRTVKRPFTVHGKRFEEGHGVMFLYASGNRDEREFDDPDTFDIHRRPPRILTFGTGPHQCLGRHIARMEGRVSLETLLPALGDYEIDHANAVRLRTEFVQGYGSLPLRFEAA